MSYTNVDVNNKLFLLLMGIAPRFVVWCVRNLVARASQLVFSVTFPERAFCVLAPSPASLNVSTLRSRLPWTSSVDSKVFRLVVLSNLEKDVGNACLCRWSRRLHLGRRRLC